MYFGIIIIIIIIITRLWLLESAIIIIIIIIITMVIIIIFLNLHESCNYNKYWQLLNHISTASDSLTEMFLWWKHTVD